MQLSKIGTTFYLKKSCANFVEHLNFYIIYNNDINIIRSKSYLFTNFK
jgi:hypothetical protein